MNIEMVNHEFKLTEDEKDWFGNRMSEGESGAVTVPTHLLNKLRKLTNQPNISNQVAKSYLIDKCYD